VIARSSEESRAVPPRPVPGTTLAAIDVEWSKNYRVTNGNIPFCFSVIRVTVPAGTAPDVAGMSYHYTSAYVETAGETQDLICAADAEVARLLDHADLIAGHQLCSDLATLARAATVAAPAIAALRAAWHRRRLAQDAHPRVIDTRYDVGHLLSGTSRRLVDVCAGLRLDVTQPELRGTSMTALHRRWLDTGDTRAREKITVLNLRHCLSTALVAMRAAGLGSWTADINVNQMLASHLRDRFAWTADPAFTALLDDRR